MQPGPRPRGSDNARASRLFVQRRTFRGRVIEGALSVAKTCPDAPGAGNTPASDCEADFNNPENASVTEPVFAPAIVPAIRAMCFRTF